MNNNATRHLSQAATFVAKGDQFYRKAAEQIIAAQKADPMLSNRQIGKYIGEVVRGKAYDPSWVGKIVAWRTTDAAQPFGEEARPGMRDGVDRAATKRILREAPLEQIEQIIDELPPSRRQAVAAAVGHGYAKARQEYDEEEARKTPAQRDEEQRAALALTQPIRKAMGGFAALGIIGHLEQATEEIRELNADASMTPELAKGIDRVLAALTRELKFSFQLLGIEEEWSHD